MRITETELRSHAETGAKWAELAERKGVHRQTVYRAARALGLRPVQHTDADILRALAGQPMTLRALEVVVHAREPVAVRSAVGRLRLAGKIHGVAPIRRRSVGGRPVVYELTDSGREAINKGTE